MTHDPAESDVTSGAEGGSTAVERSSFDVTMDEGLALGQASASRRRISSGTLLMAGVVVLAGASLWSMRAIDRAAAMAPTTSKDKDTDSFVDKALAEKGRNASSVPPEVRPLLDTEHGNDAVRVPLKDLQKNPFVLWDIPNAPVPTTPTDTPIDQRPARVAEWEKQVDSAALAIKLQSTMSGTGPQGATGLANINGHTMRLGDLFGVEGSDVEFTIEAIERDTITVRAYNADLKHERLVTVKVNRRW